MERIPAREPNQNHSAAAPPMVDRMVAEGRALAPTSYGPVPLPSALLDQEIDASATLAAARDEERS